MKLPAKVRRTVLTAAVIASLAPAAAAAETPDRGGFTAEVGLGAGYSVVRFDGGGHLRRVGPAPISFALGGFLTDRVALLARASGTSFGVEAADGDTVIWTNVVYSLNAQLWLDDQLMVSGGPGVALFSNDLAGDASASSRGWGAAGRVAWAFSNWSDYSLRLSFELSYGDFDGAMVFSPALNFEWQAF